MNQPELEGSGFVFNLIHFLWIPDYITKNIPSLNMPDTIQIVRGTPKFWYFTKKGRLLRKTKENLTINQILDSFSDNISDICALWVENKKKIFTFHYLSFEELVSLLNSDVETLTGFLQKFFLPRGDHNFVIKATWSTEMCLMEQIKNKHRIRNHAIDKYQRVATFELPVGPFQSQPVQSVGIASKIESICHKIGMHLFNMQAEKISVRQMELYFKVNENDEVVFLFCSLLKLRTVDQPEKIINLAKFNFPKQVSLLHLNMKPSFDINNDKLCIGCNLNKNTNEFVELKLYQFCNKWRKSHWNNFYASQQKQQIKQIMIKRLKKENNMKLDHTSKQNFIPQPIRIQIKLPIDYDIPPIIKKLYPNLTFEEFQIEIENEFFLQQTINVCKECAINKANCNENIEKDCKQIIDNFLVSKNYLPKNIQIQFQGYKESQIIGEFHKDQNKKTNQAVHLEMDTNNKIPLIYRLKKRELNISSIKNLSQKQNCIGSVSQDKINHYFYETPMNILARRNRVSSQMKISPQITLFHSTYSTNAHNSVDFQG